MPDEIFEQETIDVNITVHNVPRDLFYKVLAVLTKTSLKQRGEVINLSHTIDINYNTAEPQFFYDCVGSALAQQALDTSQSNAN